MPSSPTFTRSPRNYIALPIDEVEIQSPPPASNKPNVSLWMIFLPIAMMGVMGLVSSKMMGVNGSGYMVFIFMSGAVTSLYSVVNYFSEVSRYKKESENREIIYQKYLIRQKQILEELRARQYQAMLDPHPDLAECVQRALRIAPEKARRLWERSEGSERIKRDADFLDLRLGIGKARASYKIKLQTPSSSMMIEPDLLTKQGNVLADTYGWLDEVPIALSLEKVTVAGIAGSRKAVQDVARALLIQLATNHSPNEVKLVIIYPETERASWDWARWLPHTWSDDRKRRYMSCDPAQGQLILSELAGQLRQRRLQHQGRGSDNKPLQFSPSYIFIFADPSILGSTENNSTSLLLNTLLTEGHTLNAYPIFLADKPENLPKACGAIIDLTGRNCKQIVIGPPTETTTFIPDMIDAADAEIFSRALISLRARQMATASDLPTTVTLLQTLGVEKVEELNSLERWKNHNPAQSLSTPIGMRAGNDFFELDLHEKGQGPNGLIAGTVGSGKTELVQSLVASLAVNFHPHDVAFALLDFKGGDMVSPLRNFPHVLSTMTSLEMDAVPRAITSLASELDRREKIFESVRKQLGQDISHIDDYMRLYRQGKVSDPLPYLILIVDEFTVLKSTYPDEMEKFVRIAIKGRSLGFRMILATQRPQGVVSEQIDANTRLRLCLRVARVEDSQEILKRPDAANLTGTGRTYIRVGEREIFDLFQAAWGGALYEPGRAKKIQSANDIFIVDITGNRRPLLPVVDLDENANLVSMPDSHLQVIGQYLNELVVRENIQKLTGPWLSPLPDVVELSQVREGSLGWDGSQWSMRPVPVDPSDWFRPVIGLLDDPMNQNQSPLTIPLGKSGHVVIYGAPGTGKTTLLQTLITSLCLDHSPQELNLYLIDFGGRTLKGYEEFPHVGAVVTSEEEERISRLLGLLSKELEKRKVTLGGQHVNTLFEYQRKGNKDLPEIVVILDNLPEFLSLYPNFQPDLERLSQAGGNLGIHLVITSNLISGFPPRIASNISQVIALELNDISDYPQLVGRNSPRIPTGIRGRGVVRLQPPLEFQAAIYHRDNNNALMELMRSMRNKWKGELPQSLKIIPEILGLADILNPSSPRSTKEEPLSFPIGLDVSTAAPANMTLEDGPHFIIAGPAGSGKTSLMQTILLGLAHKYSPKQIGFLLAATEDASLSPLANLPHTLKYIDNQDDLNKILEGLNVEAQNRRKKLEEARKHGSSSPLSGMQSIVIALDDFDQFSNEKAKGYLQTLLKIKNIGIHVLIGGTISSFLGYGDLEKTLKEARTGFLLGSNESDATGLFGIKLDFETAKKNLPRGRGYLSLRGRHRTVQFASVYYGPLTLREWLGKIKKK